MSGSSLPLHDVDPEDMSHSEVSATQPKSRAFIFQEDKQHRDQHTIQVQDNERLSTMNDGHDDPDETTVMKKSFGTHKPNRLQTFSCDSTVILSSEDSFFVSSSEEETDNSNTDEMTKEKDSDPTEPPLSSSRSSCLCRWIKRSVIALLIFVLLLFLILVFGKIHEQRQVQSMGSTTALYQTPHVCAALVVPPPPNSATNEQQLVFETFEDASIVQEMRHEEASKVSMEALDRNQSQPSSELPSDDTVMLAHCGDCGQCSNPRDIQIYNDTQHTLYKDSLACGKKGVLGGYNAAKQCMEERVGLTEGCTDCWVDNMICTAQKCLFSCVWHMLFHGNVHGGSQSESLNACTQCDEVRCGPQFLACAGANRRRSGIVSDITRDEDEQCTVIAPRQWWNEPHVQEMWNQQQEQQENAPPVSTQGDDTTERPHSLLRH